MKKCIIITVILAMLLLLTSCEGIFGGSEDKNGPDSVTRTYTRIVYTDGFEVVNVRNEIMGVTGPIASVLDSSDEIDGEIVFGDTSRTITSKAIATLDAELANSTKYDSGYIIYSEGNNIAVYWTVDDMADAAVNAFI